MECVENVLRTQREREAEIINKDKKRRQSKIQKLQRNLPTKPGT